MTDNSASERLALRTVFPEAKLYLCLFHIIQAVWRFLGKNENAIEKNDRNALYHAFKKLIYSGTEPELNSEYLNIKQNDITKSM